MSLADRLARLERLHAAENQLQPLLLMRTGAGLLRRVDLCEVLGWKRWLSMPFRDQDDDEAAAVFDAAARAAGFSPLVLGNEDEARALVRRVDASF